MIKVGKVNIENLNDTKMQRLVFPLKVSRNVWLTDDKLVLEYPQRFNDLSNLAEAVVFSLLGIAYREASDIELPLDLPIEKGTQERIDKICELWNKWFYCNRKVNVFAKTFEPKNLNSKNKFAAMLFSGGVDSLATFIRNRDSIRYLVFYKGADIPITRDRRFKEVENYMLDFAREQNKELITVSTNARYLGAANWEYMALSCTTVGPLLAVSNYIDKIYVPATHSGEWAMDVRLGSHPDLDPLISVDRVQTIHDGFELKRPEKIMLIAQEPVLLKNLRVCQDVDYFDANMNNGNRYNCGKCEKCSYTSMALTLLGLTSKGTTFSDEALSLHSIIKFLQSNNYPEKLARQEGQKIEWAWNLELLESTWTNVEGKEELRAVLRKALGKFYDDYINGFPNGTSIKCIDKCRKLEKKLGLKPESLEWLKKIIRSLRGKPYIDFVKHNEHLTRIE